MTTGKKIVGSTYDCSKEKTTGLAVVYTPRKGFRGVDRVSLRTDFRSSVLYPITSTETVTIAVK